MREVGQRWLIPALVSRERIEAAEGEWKALARGSVMDGGRVSAPRVWFHAASVGELESLWPVALKAAHEISGLELILTVFSESARARLERLRGALASEARRQPVVFAGYSPWEGSWLRSLQALRPHLFVTAKYEAWPELWEGLSQLDIPLVIVGARARRSLRICKFACVALGVTLPRMTLLPVLERDRGELSALFQTASIVVAGEPRWDQVFSRSCQGDERARELMQSASDLPRPWGILGSAWLEDLERWKVILSRGWSGTLWVVPHRVDPESIAGIEKFLGALGVRAARSSGRGGLSGLRSLEGHGMVLVDEMGFLSELYAGADWAYVGGGFGAGVHSTIEPAIHGIPISAGPAGSENFAEIDELRETRQLSLVLNAQDLKAWLEGVRDQSVGCRPRWLEQAKARLGATGRVVGILRESLPGPEPGQGTDR